MMIFSTLRRGRPACGAPGLHGHRQSEAIEAGPNWDDDLGGSPIYAANDPDTRPP